MSGCAIIDENLVWRFLNGVADKRVTRKTLTDIIELLLNQENGLGLGLYLLACRKNLAGEVRKRRNRIRTLLFPNEVAASTGREGAG